MPAHWTVILGPFGVLATVTGSGPEGSELMMAPTTPNSLSPVPAPLFHDPRRCQPKSAARRLRDADIKHKASYARLHVVRKGCKDDSDLERLRCGAPTLPTVVDIETARR